MCGLSKGDVMADKKMKFGPRMERKVHRKVEAKSRNDILDEYSNFEMKRDLHNQFAYDRVEELYSSFYGGLDPRRKNEMADAGMVKEDRNAMANLSPEPIHQQYPRAGYYSNPYIQDSEQED
jgi:hypothetical protein